MAAVVMVVAEDTPVALAAVVMRVLAVADSAAATQADSVVRAAALCTRLRARAGSFAADFPAIAFRETVFPGTGFLVSADAVLSSTTSGAALDAGVLSAFRGDMAVTTIHTGGMTLATMTPTIRITNTTAASPSR